MYRRRESRSIPEDLSRILTSILFSPCPNTFRALPVRGAFHRHLFPARHRHQIKHTALFLNEKYSLISFADVTARPANLHALTTARTHARTYVTYVLRTVCALPWPVCQTVKPTRPRCQNRDAALVECFHVLPGACRGI